MTALKCILTLSLTLSAVFPSAVASEGGKYTIGVCVMGTRHSFFREIVDTIRKEASLVGVEILDGDADFSSERQIRIIEDFIAADVSLIMVAPFDAKALDPALQKAGRAGIPVLSIDTATDGYEVISHCESDNVAGGRLAGGLILERLERMEKSGRGGAIQIFEHGGASSTAQRVRGFVDVMTLRGKQFRLLFADAVGQEQTALEQTEKVLASVGKELVGIFATNDGMTLGVMRAVEKSGRLYDTVIMGYDYTDDLKAAVDAGKIHGVIVQFPRRIGSAAFTIAYEYLTGKNPHPPKKVLVEVGTYTREGFFDQRGNEIID